MEDYPRSITEVKTYTVEYRDLCDIFLSEYGWLYGRKNLHPRLLAPSLGNNKVALVKDPYWEDYPLIDKKVEDGEGYISLQDLLLALTCKGKLPHGMYFLIDCPLER